VTSSYACEEDSILGVYCYDSLQRPDTVVVSHQSGDMQSVYMHVGEHDDKELNGIQVLYSSVML